VKKFPAFLQPVKHFQIGKTVIGGQNDVWITNQITHVLEGYDHQLLCVDELEWLKFPQWHTEKQGRNPEKGLAKKELVE
jgi:hypothetical protein